MRNYFACLALLFVSTPALAYIDPGTSQAVLSSIGGLLAALGAGFLTVGAAIKLYWQRLRRLFSPKKGGNKNKRLLALMATCVTSALAAGVLFLLDTKQPAKDPNDGRFILIGIDGMDPKISKRLMSAGRLPNFQKLAEQGDFKKLATVNPAQSPVVWTTMATGYGPGVHGVTDFITRKENTYIPSLSLTKQNDRDLLSSMKSLFRPPVSPELFFWESLSSRGVRSKVVRWPLTFPAEGNSRILSGLGTPDLLGGMGRYTLITTAPDYFPEDIKGTILPLELNSEKGSVRILGPKEQGLGGSESVFSELRVQRVNDMNEIKITIGNETVTLSTNELSHWLPIHFERFMGESAKGMVQFMVLETTPNVHIYMSPIQVDPIDPQFPISTQDMAGQISGKLGRFHTLGMAEDTNALSDEVLNEDQFLKLCEAILEEAENMFWNEFYQDDAQFFGYVFYTLDRIEHMFWRFLDPDHPLYDEDLSAQYAGVIDDYYERIDRMIGSVMKRIDPSKDTLMIVSDHGFNTYRRNFHVNSWLIDKGYMTLKDGVQSSEGLYSQVDWSRTKAFAMGFSQIFINIKGRDERGIVAPEEVDQLKKALERDLLALSDPANDLKPVDRVYDSSKLYGMELALGPDLIVGLREGYRFSWQTAVGGAPEFVFEDNIRKWSGDHCIDPTHVPGVVFANRKITGKDPSVFDVAPTVLKHFGITPNPDMPGKSLFSRGTMAAVAR